MMSVFVARTAERDQIHFRVISGDIRELIEHLGLQNSVLVGSSLGSRGSFVLRAVRHGQPPYGTAGAGKE